MTSNISQVRRVGMAARNGEDLRLQLGQQPGPQGDVPSSGIILRCHHPVSGFVEKDAKDKALRVNETINIVSERLVELTADVVSAYVSNTSVPAAELSGLIAKVYSALQQQTTAPSDPAPEALKPAVAIKKSVTPDYIVCLEDGKQFKSLKRHLTVHYGLSPDEYRAKWGLPADYPMVAPNYAASRSALAKSMGLGRKAKPAEMPAPSEKRKKLGLKFT